MHGGGYYEDEIPYKMYAPPPTLQEVPQLPQHPQHHSNEPRNHGNLMQRVGSLGSTDEESESGLPGLTRSTKGASKQRRDLINAEILNLRDLLPLPESARQRLSQLQIMSLTCVFIRKSNYFNMLFNKGGPFTGDSPFEFSQAMNGFLLIITSDGKLLYISENVTEYLGHSMVDMMTQGDSIYDIINKRDHSVVRGHVTTPTRGGATEEERSFFCRMSMSRTFRRQSGFGDHKVMHVKGHFIQPQSSEQYCNQPMFMALCSPLITPDVKETVLEKNTMVFQSVHGLDMRLIEIAQNGEFHLGYDSGEIKGRSWYELLHPEDVAEAKEKHVQLVKSSHEIGCMLTVRLMTKSGDWRWVNIVMHIRQPFVGGNGDPAIVCINNIVNDADANQFKVQSQLYSSHIARSPEFLQSPSGGSPAHTITQVTTEQPSHYVPQGYVGREDNSGYYQQPEYTHIGQGTIIQNLSNTKPITTIESQQHPTVPQTNGVPSPNGDNKVNRQQILNKLKRKMSTAQPITACKPAKARRFANIDNNDSNSGDTLRYNASIVAGPVEFGGDGGASTLASVAQIFTQNMDLPVYVNLKKEIQNPLLQKEMVLLSQQIEAAGLPTPVSPQSSTLSPITDIKTENLTVEVPDSVVIPSSMLTPDASPASSPALKEPVSSPYQQCINNVPFDTEDLSFFPESETDKKTDSLHIKNEPAATTKFSLPELDVLGIEQFLFNPPIKTELDTKAEIQQEQQSPEQWPKLEDNNTQALSDDMLNLDESEICQAVISLMDAAARDGSNHELADIMNMSMSGDAMGGTVTAEVHQDLITVPSPCTSVESEEEAAQVPELFGAFSPSHGELLSELQTLNQMTAHANSTPSYGCDDLATSGFFNQTL